MCKHIPKSVIVMLIGAQLFFANSLSAQNRQKIDSLYALERTAKNDTSRVKLLNAICQEYLLSEPEVAFDYANQAFELANKLQFHRGKAYAYRNIGLYRFNHNEFNTAIDEHLKALDIFEKLNDRKGMLLSYNSLGLIYYKQGYYPLAIRNYLSVLALLEEIGDKMAIADNYTNIAKIYCKDGNYTQALDYLQSSLKIQLEQNDKAGLSENYNNIGNIYYDKKNYALALEYYKKALRSREEANSSDPLALAECYNNLGNAYLQMNTLDFALEFQQKALKIQQKQHDDLATAATYNNLGLVYGRTGKETEAIRNHNRAIEIGTALNNHEILKEAYGGLSSIYAKQNNFPKAYQYYLLYSASKDVVLNKENTRSMTEINAKYEFDKKEKENELLVKDKQNQALEARRRQTVIYSLIVILFIVVLLSVFIFISYRQKKAVIRELAEKNGIILKQKEEGEKEKKRSEELLLNILPTETAEELKNYGKAAPRSYKMVTVLFTDFKGFTTIAEKLTPEQLVYELDYCFRKFDEIMGRFGIEKIKTIGDAYMCAGGIPIRNRSNPVDVLLAAFEMQEFIEEWKKEKIAKGKEFWEIRIGLHTGPVVAGIVGSKKFAYDIWGDTVNTASRMESSGEAGKINISGTTHSYVNMFFDCTFRGKITAKNKGEIEMYFVERIKPRLSVNLEGRKPNDDFFKLLSTNLANRMNYKDAGQHIIKLLSEFLPESLTYHNIHHTLNVCSAVERIGKQEGIEGEQIDLLKTAALFHDAGFIRRYDNNEEIGVEIAREVLPQYGYSKKQIEVVARLIMATKIPQQPNDLLEQVMCDADLDYLGRNDFHDISDSLCKEMITQGKINNKRQWDEIQIRFLGHHKYFTSTTIKRREEKKKLYLEEIKSRFAAGNYEDHQAASDKTRT
ncbi:MAG: tetratricopeptide repeat protein [Bacteroidia bacterium]|nr:tetratricopeptide repeat protein [Bacteroidia bacterium]